MLRRTTFPTILAAIASISCAGMALAQDKVVRFSTAGPPPDFLAQSMESFAEELNGADLGLDVQVFPASKLVRQGAEVPALQRGNIEMSTMTAFEVAAQVPEFGFLNRAFLFRDYDHMMSVLSGPVGEALRAATAEEMGIEILSVAYLGTRHVNLREAREVTGPEDLEGVRLRMPATPEWLLLGESLGVSPTPLAMPEVYVALQTGAIDGQENPLTILRAAKFDEVTEQVVLTSHLVQPVFYAVAKPFWDDLTEEQQTAMRAAAESAAAMNNEGRLADEREVADVLRGEGLDVAEPNLDAFKARADEVYGDADLAEDWDAAMMEEAQR